MGIKKLLPCYYYSATDRLLRSSLREGDGNIKYAPFRNLEERRGVTRFARARQ